MLKLPLLLSLAALLTAPPALAAPPLASTPSALAPQTSQASSSRTTSGDVDRLDPHLDALVAPDAHWSVAASGFKWTEGPVWISAASAHAGYLLFAAIRSNSIRKLVPGQPATLWLQPSGYKGSAPYGGPEPGTNGMTLGPRGRLTVAGHALRNIERFETMDPHGPITILADSYQGQPLNSPNDLVYGPDGSVYFTDPPYGLRTQDDHDPHKKLSFNGVFRIPNAVNIPPGTQPTSTRVQLLIRNLQRPNGIAFSPDGKILYVSNTAPKIWMRYPVHRDGSLGPGSVLFDATSDHGRGGPDGIKLDVEGNLYGPGPGGIWIISPQGQHLGTLRTPAVCGNVAWGGPDAHTLFATCSGTVLSMPMKHRGLLPNEWH